MPAYIKFMKFFNSLIIRRKLKIKAIFKQLSFMIFEYLSIPRLLRLFEVQLKMKVKSFGNQKTIKFCFNLTDFHTV